MTPAELVKRAREFEWVPFQDVRRHGWKRQKLPPERKLVLCKIIGYTVNSLGEHPINNTGGIVAGYLRYAAGDKECPQFICSSVPGPWEVTHWCDCLPPGFDQSVPGWNVPTSLERKDGGT